MTTIVVLCIGAAEEDVSRTVQSCVEQTYRSLDIIVVTDSRLPHRIRERPNDDARVRLVRVDKESKSWVASCLNQAVGEYVTWIRAGAWYAEDAIAVLVNALGERDGAQLAYADFFLTHADVIEHKVRARREYLFDWLDKAFACFLVGREEVTSLLAAIMDLQGIETQLERSWFDQVVYVPHGLLFKPATDSEICLYRSAIAYGRGNIVDAKHLLARAIRSDPELLGPKAAVLVSTLERVARIAPGIPDSRIYAETVFQNLPRQARGLRRLKRKLLSRIAMSRLFESYQSRDRRGVLEAAWPGVWNDPSWLLNRGVLSILVDTLIGSQLKRCLGMLPHQRVDRTVDS